MASLPGCFAPTEAFRALQAGAHVPKFFPAEGLGSRTIKAVLPADVPTPAVGGVIADTMANWVRMGISGFGPGSALYAPGSTAADVNTAARAFVAAGESAIER